MENLEITNSIDPEDEKLLKKQKKIEKIEQEKNIVLNNVLSGNILDTRDRVAYILNGNSDSRNSDIELAWAYWSTFENEHFNGTYVTKTLLLSLTKIATISRWRAKIQNEYNLFLADPEVRQYRGKLEEDFKEQAITHRAPNNKSYFVYIDETGKNQRFISVGSFWLLNYSNKNYLYMNDIKDWKKHSGIDYEFHFKDVKPQKLDHYKTFIQLFLSKFPENSFKTIIIDSRGLGDKHETIKELTYYLIKKGIEHENSTGRAPLPRRLSVFIDQDEKSKDTLKIEFIKDRLQSHNIDGLELGDFEAIDSKSNFNIQIIDLFTGAINRKLNPTDGDRNVKDELADFILNLLNINVEEYINDTLQMDTAKVFNLDNVNG
ncbi:DUF3800 domain-containing protein [Sphingobacterium faecium]|uniref:DUF3800 domain-containing protein n=1 Tax=Sphingobacterium faecium TaxID=34087 RepID=UPI0032087CBC